MVSFCLSPLSRCRPFFAGTSSSSSHCATRDQLGKAIQHKYGIALASSSSFGPLLRKSRKSESSLLRLTQSDADRDVVKRDYFSQTGSIINGLVSRQNNFFGVVGMLGFGMWILGLRRKNRDMGRRFQLETPYTICVKISQLQNESPRSRSLNISSRGKHANNLPRDTYTLSVLTIKYLENAYRCCGYKDRQWHGSVAWS